MSFEKVEKTSPLDIDINTLLEDKEKEIKPKAKSKAKSPAKPKTKASKKNDELMQEQLKVFLGGISELIALIPNMHIWRLTESELNMIIPPMSNIIKKHGVSEKIMEYSDYTMLIAGIGMIIYPRIIYMSEQKKKGENNARLDNRTVTGKPDSKHTGEIRNNNQTNNNTTTTNSPYDDSSRLSALDYENIM